VTSRAHRFSKHLFLYKDLTNGARVKWWWTSMDWKHVSRDIADGSRLLPISVRTWVQSKGEPVMEVGDIHKEQRNA
jgi:hypothetical protein